MEREGDSIMFYDGRKPDLLPGKVEWAWAGALGSGVPSPPVWALSQVGMGSSHWLETLEKRWGSGVT